MLLLPFLNLSMHMTNFCTLPSVACSTHSHPHFFLLSLSLSLSFPFCLHPPPPLRERSKRSVKAFEESTFQCAQKHPDRNSTMSWEHISLSLCLSTGWFIHTYRWWYRTERTCKIGFIQEDPPVLLKMPLFDGLSPGAALWDVYIAQILFTWLLIKRPGLREYKHPPWSILPPTAECLTKGAFRTYYMPDM